MNESGKIQVPISTGIPGSRVMLTGDFTVDKNKWNHLCGVYDGANILAYLNGIQDPTTQPANLTVGTNNIDARLGAYMTSGLKYGWNGQIDEVAIWNRPLQSNEVQELATQCYDLSPYLSSDYLADIPKDPKTGTDADTGYAISKSPEGAITISAVNPDAIDNQTLEIKVSR